MFNSLLHLPHNKSLIGASDKQDDGRNRLGIELVSSSLIRMRSEKKPLYYMATSLTCLTHVE